MLYNRKLEKCVTLFHNDEDCVILKTRDDKYYDLLKTGCFNGDEHMFRITKDPDRPIYTVISQRGHLIWSTGERVSDEIYKKRDLMYDTIVYGFGIPVFGTKAELAQFNFIHDSSDELKHGYTFNCAGFDPAHCAFRKNDVYLGSCTKQEALEYVIDRYGENRVSSKEYKAPATGCLVCAITVRPDDGE